MPKRNKNTREPLPLNEDKIGAVSRVKTYIIEVKICETVTKDLGLLANPACNLMLPVLLRLLSCRTELRLLLSNFAT